MRTTSPSRAPARASAFSTPIFRSRCCTYSIASRLVRSAMATTRSAVRPCTRHAPSSSRTTVKPSSAGRSTTNGSGSGSSARARVDQRAEPAEELVEALAGDRRDAAVGAVECVTVERVLERRCDVGLRRRRRAAAGRAARAGSGRARRAAPAPAPPAAVRRPARGRAAPRAPAPARRGGGTGARGRVPRRRPR